MGHNKTISGELRISFCTNFKLLEKILLSKGMHFLWVKSLIIRYKNEPLLLSLGGCLEEKNGQISGA